jgi:hypothetical protein
MPYNNNITHTAQMDIYITNYNIQLRPDGTVVSGASLNII